MPLPPDRKDQRLVSVMGFRSPNLLPITGFYNLQPYGAMCNIIKGRLLMFSCKILAIETVQLNLFLGEYKKLPFATKF